MTRSEVLGVRREVNRQRQAGHTEARIAARLTASRISPPTGDAWRKAGVGPTWTAQGVTRFMECTRHVKAPPAKVTAKVTASPAPAATTSARLRVTGARAATIYTSAPNPRSVIRYPQ